MIRFLRRYTTFPILLAIAAPTLSLAQSPAARPSQAQIEQAMATQPGAGSMIRQRIRTSGLTPEQIRQRLKAAGYSESLLDAYLGSAEGPAPDSTGSNVMQAVTALGIVDKQEADALAAGAAAVEQVAPPPVQVEAAQSRVFGLNVFRQSTSQFQPDLAGPVDASYKIGPRDVLALIITGGVEASYSLEVTREGFVVIPQVGQVFVANLTLEQLEDVMFRRLRSVYSGIGRDANASTRFYVTIVRLRTNQVFVVGEAVAPSSYQVASVGTMLTALYGAGGPSDIGSLRNVQLRRAGQVVSTLDVYDYLIRGDASKDARLETGDVIFVPVHGPRVDVAGEVLRPAIYELRAGESLRDVITMAGGFKATAGRRRIVVTRILPAAQRDSAGGRERRVYDVTADAFTGDQGPEFALEDGDRVQVFPVAERVRNRVVVSGAVWNPGPQGLSQGMTLSQALRNAGGVKPEVKDVLIWRLQSDQTQTTLRAFFRDTLGTLVQDLVLQEDDSVNVYATTDFRPDRFVAINGAVRKDGRYEWREGMTLRDLVHEAGGLEDGAYLVEAEVARLPEDRQHGKLAVLVRVPLDSTYLLERGLDGKYLGPPGIAAPTGTAPDVALHPYDNILILRQPEWLLERRVTILGEVLFPGTYALARKDEPVSSLIGRAGGVLPTAYAEAAVFMRPSRNVGRVGFDLQRVLEDSTYRNNFALEPGDTLTIPRYIPTVQVQGSVHSPIAVAYQHGKRLRYYVAAAGGETFDADVRSAYVQQPNGIVTPYKRRLLLPDANPRVQAGAVVVVPAQDPEDKKDWTAIAGSIAQILTSAVAVMAIVSR